MDSIDPDIEPSSNFEVLYHQVTNTSVDTVNTVPVNKNQIAYVIYMQAHNQKFLRAGEVSCN